MMPRFPPNTIAPRLCFVAGLLGACTLGPGAPPPDAAFTGNAIAYLNGLQARSIRLDREVCGYFGRDRAGAFVATDPVLGESDHCDLPLRPLGVSVVASYHTHGAHSPEYDTEVPSLDDVESDRFEKTYGYIATPGGRVWLVDWTTGVSNLICDTGCVLGDPNYDPSLEDPIAGRYTLDALIARSR